MPTTEPLTGARVPAQNDGPLGGLQIANAVKDITKYVVPDFTTTAARDAAYSAFVTGGGVLRNGMMCTVGNNRYRRYSGVWLLDTNNGGTSGVLAGSAPPAGTPLLIKTFYASVVHNGSGDGTVIFPGGAFPNGLLTADPVHYSAGAAPSNDLEFVPWGATLSSVNTRCYGPTGAVFGATGIALICTAIGW